MKKTISLISIAVLAIGLLVSCQKDNTPTVFEFYPETMSLADILLTNPDIPEVENTTPPSNAWVNSSDTACKAFIGIMKGTRRFIFKKEGAQYFGINMTDSFEKMDGNTYQGIWDNLGTMVVKMTDGKFTSLEYRPESGCPVENLGGTYAAPVVP